MYIVTKCVISEGEGVRVGRTLESSTAGSRLVTHGSFNIAFL